MATAATIAKLVERIEAWPDELKQALIAGAQARAKVTDLARKLDDAREFADDDDDPSASTAEQSLYAVRDARYASEQVARHKREMAYSAYHDARSQAHVRIVREYEASGKKVPPQTTLYSLVDVDADVQAKHDTFRQAEEEMHAALQRRLEPAAPAPPTTSQPHPTVSPSLQRLERELATAEAQAQKARAEVRYQHARGRALEMLVRLSASQTD